MLGMDYLGLGHKLWPVKETIRNTPKGWAIGCFDGTTGHAQFGDCIPAIKDFIREGGFPAYRINLFYHKDHIICPMEILKSRAPAYKKMIANHPQLKFYLSHSTEHEETNAAKVKERMDALSQLCPGCIPVNSIVGGAMSDGINETHGMNPIKGKFLTSLDGADVAQLDVETYLQRMKGAEINFLWAPRFNLRQEYAKPSDLPEPMKRTAAPDRRYVCALARLGSPEGVLIPTPAFAGKKIVPFKKPFLYKVFAEDKAGAVNVRANKPLCITPSTAKVLYVIDCNGNRVCLFRYFGPYENGLHRHYSGTGSNLYGYEIARRAKKASGSEYVWIHDAEKDVRYGPVNPAFRRGFFE